jgi:Subtilase family/PatG C-terminal
MSTASLAHTGLPTLAAAAAGVAGLVVGLVDGPVDTHHPALAPGRIVAVDGSAPACARPDGPACRHGTFVAGQLASLCPQCTVIAYPLFCEAADLRSCPSVRPHHLADALTALMDRGARIINMSVGLDGPHTGSLAALERCYRRAEAQGVILVAAAGNDGHDDANPLVRDPWVIPVAAQDPRGRILPTSNRGGTVARQGLLAPGHELLGLAAGGGHLRMSGTSVAAPLVTAGAALLWSLHPNASAAEIRRALLRPGAARHLDVPPPLDLVDSQRWLRRRPHAPVRSESTTMHQHHRSAARDGRLTPQGALVLQACACQTGATQGFVYSTGTLSPRFPDEGDQREFEARARELRVPSDDFYTVLGKYRYLARRICWALVVNERPTAILVPRSDSELSDLVAALAPELQPDPLLAVTGLLGGTASPAECNGLEVPRVYLSELDYFTRDALLKHLADEVHLDPGASRSDLDKAAQRLWTLLGVFREPGLRDEQRAKNYLALRTTAIYETTVALSLPAGGRYWLASVACRVGSTEDGRRVADVDFVYQASSGQTLTYRAEVDVTNLFPFQSKALYLA